MTTGLRKRTRYHVQIPSDTIRDGRISYRARGVLGYLLDKPDGWDVRSEAIANDGTGTEGREAVRTALHELGAHGYYRLERRKLLNSGRVAMGTAVSELPVPEWAEEYAEFEGKPVPMDEVRPGVFRVRRKNGSFTPDGFEDVRDKDEHESVPPGETEDGFPDPGHPDPGHPDPGHPDPGHPDPAYPDPPSNTEKDYRSGITEKSPPEASSYTDVYSSASTPPSEPAPAHTPNRASGGGDDPDQSNSLSNPDSSYLDEARQLLSELPYPMAPGPDATRDLAPAVAAAIADGWKPEQLQQQLTPTDIGAVRKPMRLLRHMLNELPAPPPATGGGNRQEPKRPQWCGAGEPEPCNPDTRLREPHHDAAYRCPDCHPDRVSQATPAA